MNAAAAHNNEFQKLLEDLSSDTLVSGITFVALVNAYIMRLDTNCPDTSRRTNPPPAPIDGELIYGTNIDSKLRALLRATRNFKTARHVFPKISCRDPQANDRYSLATAARQTLPGATAFPGQRPLINVDQRVNPKIDLPKPVTNSRTSKAGKRSPPTTPGPNVDVVSA